MLNLTHEVVKVKLVLADFLLQALRLFLVKLLLGALHQTDDVAHAQDAVGHALRVEHIDSLHLLARTHKLDRLRHHGADAQCSTTARVTIQFGQYHAVKVQPIVKLLRRVHSVLTRHRVHYKQRLVGLYSLLQGGYLVHHLLVHGQSTSGIDDHHVIILLLSLADSVLGYLHHVLVLRLRIHVHAYALAHHVQLLYSSRTIHVASHQQRILVLLLLQHVGQLTAERRLTRTLQTRHQDDGWPTLQFQFHGLAAHQLGQLVVHYLHHQLTGFHGCQHVHTHCLLLHGVRKCLGHLVVHVRIQQRLAHIFQRLGNVNLGDFSLTFQYLERPFKSIT